MPAQLRPPNGLPSATTFAEEEAWSTLVATQLADFRKTAENWRNGLVAVIGLITAFSVVNGPDDLSGLDRWAEYGVGVLLVLALACALAGAWAALSAAYGTPSVITRQAVRNFGGVIGFRLDLARTGISKLRLAQAATLVTLSLLAAAVGLTWYGPRTTTLTLDIERMAEPNICGKVLESGDGYLDVKPPESQTVRVRLTDLVRVRGVEKCP